MFSQNVLHNFFYDPKLNDYETNQKIYQRLYDYYIDEIPYGTLKARTGDPEEWIWNKIGDMRFEQFLKFFK